MALGCLWLCLEAPVMTAKKHRLVSVLTTVVCSLCKV